MISSEVERTLVKSPPELWAELSDPAALARHLGEFGEIRIVRTEPETTVEWTAENTTGTVSIKPSGWGTKVTLSVTREVAQETSTLQAAPTEDRSPPSESPPVLETGPPEAHAAVVIEPAASAVEIESEPPASVLAPMPSPEIEPEPRRGFFARLFGRRRAPAVLRAAPAQAAAGEPARAAAPEPAPAKPDAFAAVRRVLAPETFAAAHPFAAIPVAESKPETVAIDPERVAERRKDISSELMAVEEASAEEVTAVLTAVLDRLGAAHHRPFSRA